MKPRDVQLWSEIGAEPPPHYREIQLVSSAEIEAAFQKLKDNDPSVQSYELRLGRWLRVDLT